MIEFTIQTLFVLAAIATILEFLLEVWKEYKSQSDGKERKKKRQQ